MLHFALRRVAERPLAGARRRQASAHAALKGQKPCVLWFTGLSGAGKSTIANLVEKQLHALGRHTYLLDGDNVRHGLNKDLGFTDADRVENIRRVAEVAQADGRRRPDRARRRSSRRSAPSGDMAREPGRATASSSRCSSTRRSPSPSSATRRASTRRRARGELKNFTGIDSPYEPPEHAGDPHRHDAEHAEEAAEAIVEYLALGRLGPAELSPAPQGRRVNRGATCLSISRGPANHARWKVHRRPAPPRFTRVDR